MYWGGYGAYPAAISPQMTNIVVMQPPPAQIAPAPAPTPVRAAVREYKDFQESAAPAPEVELQYFVLVMKDGSGPEAALVWIQGSELRYVTPEGDQVRVPAGSVDREATRQLNRARNLNLRLP